MSQYRTSTRMAQLEIPTHDMCKVLQDISFRDLSPSKLIAHYDQNMYWPMKLRTSFGQGLYQSFASLCYMQDTQKVAREMNVSDIVSVFVMFLLGRANRFVGDQQVKGGEVDEELIMFLQQLNNMDKEQHFHLYKEMLEGVKFEVSLSFSQTSLDNMTRFHSAREPGADIITRKESNVSLIMEEGGQRKIKRHFPFDN